MFGTAAIVVMAIIAWVLANKFISFMLYIVKIDIYYFQHDYNLLQMV